MSSQIDIAGLSQMAKLDLSEAERTEAAQVLDFLSKDFDRLDPVDTANAMPLIHGIELTNVMREDRAVQTISRDELLQNAPEQSEGYFQAPRTLE